MGTIGNDHNLIFTAAGGPGPSPIPEPGTLAAMAILPVARPRRDGADAKREGWLKRKAWLIVEGLGSAPAGRRFFFFSSFSEREVEPPDPKRRQAAALQKGWTAANA